jgi:hypothetical protein
MRLAITTLDGATRTVRVTAADRVAWEAWARRQGLPLTPRVTNAGTDHAAVDVEGFPLDTYHLFLAWKADTRDADPRPPFAGWLDDKDSVVPLEDPAADPTRAGRPPA